MPGDRSEPGSEYPALFSDQLNKLIDIKIGDDTLYIENENYRYLAERSFVTTKYRYGKSEISNSVIITSKGFNFLIKCKLGDFDKLHFDRTNAVYIVHMLAGLITSNLDGNSLFDNLITGKLDNTWSPPFVIEITKKLHIQRLTFLGLVSKDFLRVTPKGERMIRTYLSRHSEDVVLNHLAGDAPWWREYLAKEIPLYEWATLLVKLSPDDTNRPEVNEAWLERRKQFADLLRSR